MTARRQWLARCASSAILIAAAGMGAAPAHADSPPAMVASPSSLSFPLLTSPNVGLEAIVTLTIDPGYHYLGSDEDYVVVGDDPVPHQVTQIDDQACRDRPTGPTCTVYIRTWSQLWQDAHEPRGDTEIFWECNAAGDSCPQTNIPFTFGPDTADRFVPSLPSTPAQLDFTDVPAGSTATHDVAIQPDSGFAFAYPWINGAIIPAPSTRLSWNNGTCSRGVPGDCTGQIVYSPLAPMPSTEYRFAAVENRGAVSIYPANLGWVGHANAVGQQPQFTSADHAIFTVGAAGSVTISSTGAPAASLTESGPLPAGVSFTAHPDGTATLAGTPAAHTVGSYPITLTATNGVVPDATQTFMLNVIKARSTTTLAASPTASRFGQPVTLTATVTSLASDVSGAVDFYDNGTMLGTANLGGGGTASLTVSTLPAGDDVLTANYRGDSDHGESVSTPVHEAVTYTRCVSGTATSVTVSTGESVCVTGTVTGPITVRAGGSLALVGAQVLGRISTTGARAVSICGSTIAASVAITGSTGPVLVGSIGDTAGSCAGNRIIGSLTVNANTGGVEIGANSVIGATSVRDNVSTTRPLTEIAGNSIGGTLSCTGNTPAPSNAGQVNTVIGVRTGQCLAARI